MRNPKIETRIDFQIIGDNKEKYYDIIEAKIAELDEKWVDDLRAFLNKVSDNGKRFKFRLTLENTRRSIPIEEAITNIEATEEK